MFSGIVERTVALLERRDGRFRFDRTGWDISIAPGSSIAFNGVCLTAVEISDEVVGVDVVPETLRRTNLGALEPGAPVNVERSVTLGTLLDGGLVLGHVDGVATVTDVDDEGIVVRYADRFDPLVVEKGTIVLNGVALTVAELAPASARVALIPETRRRTNLGTIGVGAAINVEFDVIGKYVARLQGVQVDHEAEDG